MHNPWFRLAAAALISMGGLGLLDGQRLVAAAPASASAPVPQANPGASRWPVARPSKAAGIAAAPPEGARPSQALSFNTALRWKSDAKTRTVFAVDENRQLWFIEPNSGWPYTIDQRGVVYTANARTGDVYVVNTLAAWPGPRPYFFGYWSLSNGLYVVPTFDVYASLYLDAAVTGVLYADTYSTLWELNEAYFASDAFGIEAIDSAGDAGALSDPAPGALDSDSSDAGDQGTADPQGTGFGGVDAGGGGFDGGASGGFDAGGGGGGGGAGGFGE